MIPLLANGLIETWFGYRDQRAALDRLLRTEAGAAASRIDSFVAAIVTQLGWAVQLPWNEGADERQRIDAQRLLRQVPAFMSVTLVDGHGRERIHVSRVGVNRFGSGRDLAGDPAVQGALAASPWYGPVTYHRGSEPFMTVAVAGNRSSVGVAVAEVNLKLIWELISSIRVGRTGYAFVLDEPGSLVAHPDLSVVLRGADEANLRPFRDLRETVLAAGGQPAIGVDADGRTVMAAMAPIAGVNWWVVVEQPLSEAFAAIYAALWRTGIILLAATGLAAALAYWLARRMAKPIHQLEDGVGRIGAGQFDHRIELATGDELERLAARVNAMAEELAVSRERSERIDRLKRFLAPQVAELVERASDDGLLEGRRAEVAVVFCDLRSFTQFSNRAEPEEVLHVLAAYYRALGCVIDRHEATLASFQGDGLMVLMNAPFSRPDPAGRAVALAIDMQFAVQGLIAEWLERGHRIGFGVGLAMGIAIVGRVGTENRIEYTAVGNVVNLAARLCALAADGQILTDEAVAAAVGTTHPATPLGARVVKGFKRPVEVFAVQGARSDARAGQERTGADKNKRTS